MKDGFIIKENAGIYSVFDGKNIYECRARGKFRIGNYSPSVGDNVTFDEELNYLLDIKKRKNQLIRPNIVNVENVYVVASVENPKIKISLINRYILISEIIHIKPKIILTKVDLCLDNYHLLLKEQLEKLGYEVFMYSSKTQEGLKELEEEISHKKAVFFGQSGVGKSTLINFLVPGSRQKTNEISNALNRGKHTTRVCEYLRYKDGFICDTPGFSNINFEIDLVDAASFYPGFEKYYANCKFNNCLHDSEKDCRVKDAVKHNLISKEIYDDYLALLSDLRNKKKVF